MEGIFGIISPFLCAVLVILIVFLTKMSREKSRNEVIKTAIEHGKDLPSNFFEHQTPPRRKGDLLMTSLAAIGCGIGLFLALYFLLGLKYAAFGCIPFFVGLGQLVAYLINRKKYEVPSEQN